MKKYQYSDTKFQELASQVNQALIENDGLIGDQKEQVELLFQLEKKFKYNIQKYQQSVKIYELFVKLIMDKEKNILSAKPYFRENSNFFNANISQNLKDRDHQSLMKYDINFQFINFIVKNWKGKLPERPKRYYDDFLEARRILIENNLPLAINRAKLFYRKTPRSHLSLLDLIDICSQGLIVGIDKYVGTYTKVWRSVCIGRMTNYMIEEYSKTFLRMYPSDKRILYRTNSLRYRLKIENIEELTKAVNESFVKDKAEGKQNLPKLPIKEVHIRTLLNGTSYISAESPVGGSSGEDNEKVSIYDYTSDKNQDNAEEALIKKDLLAKIAEATNKLSIIERKIIKLKGVNLW
jgi:DNA-directed RNA polymerase sigma subunit (sigma70/sigma32)